MVSGSRTRCPFHPVWKRPDILGMARRCTHEPFLEPPDPRPKKWILRLVVHVSSDPFSLQISIFCGAGICVCEREEDWHVDCGLVTGVRDSFPGVLSPLYPNEEIWGSCVGGEIDGCLFVNRAIAWGWCGRIPFFWLWVDSIVHVHVDGSWKWPSYACMKMTICYMR